MDIVDRLRMGGPNAAEVTDKAADVIKALRDALFAIEIQYPHSDTVLCEAASRRNADDDGEPIYRHWAEKIIAARAALAQSNEPA